MSGHIGKVVYNFRCYCNMLKTCFNFTVWPQHKALILSYLKKRVEHQMSFESHDFQKLIFHSKTLVLETKTYFCEIFRIFYFLSINQQDFLSFCNKTILKHPLVFRISRTRFSINVLYSFWTADIQANVTFESV